MNFPDSDKKKLRDILNESNLIETLDLLDSNSSVSDKSYEKNYEKVLEVLENDFIPKYEATFQKPPRIKKPGLAQNLVSYKRDVEVGNPQLAYTNLSNTIRELDSSLSSSIIPNSSKKMILPATLLLGASVGYTIYSNSQQDEVISNNFRQLSENIVSSQRKLKSDFDGRFFILEGEVSSNTQEIGDLKTNYSSLDTFNYFGYPLTSQDSEGKLSTRLKKVDSKCESLSDVIGTSESQRVSNFLGGIDSPRYSTIVSNLDDDVKSRYIEQMVGALENLNSFESCNVTYGDQIKSLVDKIGGLK